MIEQFRGEHFFLSNMYPLECHILTDQNVSAPSSEHAYQAAKFADLAVHHQVAWASAEARGQGEKLDGIAAKNFAHELIAEGELTRPNWQTVKLGVMHEVVRRKFIANPGIREQLAATGDEELVEGNDWGDVYWGVEAVNGRGENHLGKILMSVRRGVQDGKFL